MGPDNERPRTTDTTWNALAQVIYAWTDRRAGAEDKAWWRHQSASYCRAVLSPGCAAASEANEEALPHRVPETETGRNWIDQCNLIVMETEETRT